MMPNSQDDHPKIGVFNTSAPLILEMAPNGGWIVSQSTDARCHAATIGAYSSAEDMLRALSAALIPMCEVGPL